MTVEKKLINRDSQNRYTMYPKSTKAPL